MTGNVLDRGVDTNGNGLYDYLDIGVQINVTVAGEFQVQAFGLSDEYGNYISVFNYSQGLLDLGIQYLNVSLSGQMIFGSRLNPKRVSTIQLAYYNSMDGGFMDFLGAINDVPLSRVYDYAEFEPPGAYLTGTISDRGVDTDRDGLFNYLEVGAELNVTQAGQYRVESDGLIDKSQVQSNYFYDYQQVVETFTVGIHTVYLNFSGSGIVSSHISPTHVESISVWDNSNAAELSYLNSVPLSKRYDTTLFNTPSKNIQVNFEVYPDATVAVDGELNFTHMYPENTYMPQMNVTMGFSTTGSTTTETVNGNVTLPENPIAIYNSIESHARSVYENGLENDVLNASAILTPELSALYPFNATDFNLNATYHGGLFDVDINGQTVMSTALGTVFPFNMTDATVRADFDGTALTGNITFHAVPGFPFADVTVNFSGNRSSLHFTGDVNVTYASYDGFQIDETTLDQNLADLTANFPGQGPGSLYNTTGGYLTCTNIYLTKTEWSDPTLGAEVKYDATVVGNFTGALASMMLYLLVNPGGTPAEQSQGVALVYACLESASSSVGNASVVISYYHSSQIAEVDAHLTMDVHALTNSLLLLVPPTIPEVRPVIIASRETEKAQIEAFLKIANATAYALTDAGIRASYSSAKRQFSMNAWLSANDSQLKRDMLPILPDTAPPNMHDIFESFFNTTYGNITYSNSTFDIVNGRGAFGSTATFEGDFKAELNHAKNFLVAVMSPSGSVSSWELRLLNETEININNFQVELGLGQDWMHASFSGLILKPPSDEIDIIRFRLKSWLQTANDPSAPPGDYEKLTITVAGGSSANETVLLSQPSGAPAPDSFSEDYRSMAWNNASLSSLQDLMFLIASRQQINYNGRTYDIPILTNSTVTSFALNPGAKAIIFNVTGLPGVGFCNVTIPRNLLNASSLSDWTVTLDGKILTQPQFTITQNAEYVFVYLNYTHSQHVITITGTQLVDEFQPDILPLALAVPLIIIAAMIAVKQRRRLALLKARCCQTLARATSRLKPS